MEPTNLPLRILALIKKKQSVSSHELEEVFGFSRAYINRFLKQLINKGAIVRQGNTNRARYTLSNATVPATDWTLTLSKDYKKT